MYFNFYLILNGGLGCHQVVPHPFYSIYLDLSFIPHIYLFINEYDLTNYNDW